MKSRPATFTLLFCPSLLSENSSIPSSKNSTTRSLAKPNVNRLRLSSTWINIVCECGSLSLSLSQSFSLAVRLCWLFGCERMKYARVEGRGGWLGELRGAASSDRPPLQLQPKPSRSCSSETVVHPLSILTCHPTIAIAFSPD